MRLRNIGRVAVSALILATMPSVAAHAGVIVASSGPSAKSYPVGKKVGPADTLVLKAGDTVTVLDEKGSRVLKGAGRHALSASAATDRSGTFALLTRQRSAQRMRTGAVRDDQAGEISQPNLWYVDVRKSGTMCLAGARDVRLWRPVTAGAATYSVQPANEQNSAKVAFADGEMLAGWDISASPIGDGARYTIVGSDGVRAQVTFKVLETVPATAEDLALALIDKGCTAQLEVLSKAMNAGEGTTPA